MCFMWHLGATPRFGDSCPNVEPSPLLLVLDLVKVATDKNARGDLSKKI